MLANAPCPTTPLTCSQGYDTSYGANGYMAYPAYPMGYPTHNENVAPVGLIPVELEIEGLYEDYDRRRRKNGSEKIVSSHVHSVSDSKGSCMTIG